MSNFDLEERTTNFAKAVIRLCKGLPRNPINNRLIDQVVGASGSVGANYIEANEALSKKDFLMRIRISLKEVKETVYWLKLILYNNLDLSSDIDKLVLESVEVKKILGAILKNSQ